ncbi:hypothetical protein Prudu_018840 [Prunus dulcis]|uniref:Uncharacterized protein n=1 Tax=Prunus dulcis TaxID=3755 RepID=A0A4Y1RRN3_PRUDU|nr:hypothetical protein Prudu_018840 [Prunus dulcis]
MEDSWENGEMSWQKQWTTIEAGKIVLTRLFKHRCGSVQQGVASFNHHECWEVVKYCQLFIIIPTGPAVVLNETPLRDSMTSDSPLDSPMSQDSPIEKEPRPIGRKAAKAKKAGNSSNNNSKFLEEIARQNGIRIGNSSRVCTRNGVFAQKRYGQDRSGNHDEGYKPYVP